MKAYKGSVTVMLILVLCAVILSVTLVVEVARIRIAEGQAKRAVDTALFSALASYDQDTKDDYGLFYRYGTDGLENEIQGVVEKNLLINDGSSAWHPYEFQIKAVKVRLLFPLNDKESIKHQIVEHMKYRGPVELSGDVMVKLGAFFSMQSTSRVMKEDMNVDKSLKKITMEIKSLKKEMAVVEGFTLEKHSLLCRYAKSLSGLFSQIKQLEYDIEILEERDDHIGSGEPGNNAGQLDAKRKELSTRLDEIKSNAEDHYKELSPIVAAHENAVKRIGKLKILGQEAETAIKMAEDKMNSEKGLITNVKSELENKYVGYKNYVNRNNLTQLERALTNNLIIIKPQLKALERIKDSGEKPGDYPSVFSRDGYQGCGFESEPFPGTENVNMEPMTFDWGLVNDILDELDMLKKEIKTLAQTDDDEKGSILKCPDGGGGEETKESVSPVSEDPFDRANDTVASAYNQIGGELKDVSGSESNNLMNGLTLGAAKLSRDAYDALLINEYVLKTFNNRANGKGELHEKHHLSETEVEYVLIGSTSPSGNAFLTQSEILAWRTVFNAISFTVYCKEVSNILDEASLALNAATGIPYPLWKGTLTGIFALMESCLDVIQLYANNEISMFKYSISELSIVRRLQEITDRIGSKQKLQITDDAETLKKSSTPEKNLMVDYEDHLRAMLLYRTMSGQSDTILYRIQDLVYTNIRKIHGDYDPSQHVNFIEADARFTIKSFFPNLSGIKVEFKGIPMRHTISVECGRGY